MVILGLATDGVDVVVEVAAGTNAALDSAVLAANGTVTAYATDGGSELGLSIRELMSRNIRYQFVLVYTVPPAVKDAAVADVVAAAAAGALEVGTGAGLPLLRFPLEQTAAAHSVCNNTIKAWRRAGIVTGTRYNDKGEYLYYPPDPANPPRRPKIGRRPRTPDQPER